MNVSFCQIIQIQIDQYWFYLFSLFICQLFLQSPTHTFLILNFVNCLSLFFHVPFHQQSCRFLLLLSKYTILNLGFSQINSKLLYPIFENNKSHADKLEGFSFIIIFSISTGLYVRIRSPFLYNTLNIEREMSQYDLILILGIATIVYFGKIQQMFYPLFVSHLITICTCRLFIYSYFVVVELIQNNQKAACLQNIRIILIKLKFIESCRFKTLFMLKSIICIVLGILYICAVASKVLYQIQMFYCLLCCVLFHTTFFQLTKLQFMSKQMPLFYISYAVSRMCFFSTILVQFHGIYSMVGYLGIIYWYLHLRMFSAACIFLFIQKIAIAPFFLFQFNKLIVQSEIFQPISQPYFLSDTKIFAIYFCAPAVLFAVDILQYTFNLAKESQNVNVLLLRMLGLTQRDGRIAVHYDRDDEYRRQEKVFNSFRYSYVVKGDHVNLIAEQQMCSICLSSVCPNTEVNSSDGIRLYCRHYFHENCVRIWIKYDHLDCPVCRGPIQTEQVCL